MNLLLEDFLKAVETGLITKHETEHFVGFKYSPETVYARNWTELALNARGVAFDKHTGEVIARPFKKFFNYSEFFDENGNTTGLTELVPESFRPNLSGKFKVMNKVDGSLGISYFDKYDNKWKIKTGGSFDSDQAIWATNWLEQEVNTAKLDKTKTYCFEIVYKEDIHICNYGDFEGLVLLGILDNSTGEELSQHEIISSALELGVCSADVIELHDFNEVIKYATTLPKTEEGVVVTFDNGYKCKIKSEEWLKLFKVASCLSNKFIWENVQLDEKNDFYFTDEFLVSIPEEMKQFKTYAAELLDNLKQDYYIVTKTANELFNSGLERKFVYQKALAEQPRLVAPIMSLYSCFVRSIDDKLRIKQQILDVNKP